uniref:Very-long-chain aldehyde decarbonylase CER1-like C-terminal domain-containing protein n=1 Tax=Quercus lobata TaxID=97700 RepID=A0A7N2R2S5_QUELO
MAAVIHPFAEHIVYFMLFSIPILTTVFTGTGSLVSLTGYILYIDVMNNMGHCNFELIPKRLFSIFPPLKYLMYTPSVVVIFVCFLNLVCFIHYITPNSAPIIHFSCLYMTVYGTMDKSTDAVYETSLERPEESPKVVHLTHLTTLESIYYLSLGFATLASKPHTSKWYLWLMWPMTSWSLIITWIYGNTFVVEANTFEKLKWQSWVVPRYTVQYKLQWPREEINSMIERAILHAEMKGVKGEELNRNGELYIQRYPQLKLNLVDGSSLVVAVVLNSIPKGTTEVLLRGKLTKVAYAIANTLCERDIKVATLYKDEYEKLHLRLTTKMKSNLIHSTSYAQKTWLVGDGWTEEEQLKASKGTLFIPFSQFPPKNMSKDCFYHSTPAMIAPKSFTNIHSCENWLTRRVMSAWRIAGILHGLEGWNVHECGDSMFNIEEIWQASLRHGFQPLTMPN